MCLMHGGGIPWGVGRLLGPREVLGRRSETALLPLHLQPTLLNSDVCVGRVTFDQYMSVWAKFAACRSFRESSTHLMAAWSCADTYTAVLIMHPTGRLIVQDHIVRMCKHVCVTSHLQFARNAHVQGSLFGGRAAVHSTEKYGLNVLTGLLCGQQAEHYC